MSDSSNSSESLDPSHPAFRLEDPAKYKPGGYCPLEIGQELHNNRYRILHRLGHGGYSTVWLALDQSYDTSAPPDPLRPRYVALKIVSASRGQQEATLLRELQAQLQPRLARPSPPGHYQHRSGHIIALLDYFQISGPNGSHCCLVTEVLGPSVAALHRYPGIAGPNMLPLSIARCVAMQCAEALAVLHSWGIVHAGIFYRRAGLLPLEQQLTECVIDLHPGNIALALTADINSLTVEQLYEALGGKPTKIPFDEAPGTGSYDSYDSTPLDSGSYDSSPIDKAKLHEPEYLVATPSVPHLWALCATTEPRIRIIDLSESFRIPFCPDSQPLPGTPRGFAAPELLLNLPAEVNFPIDIWALGCTIYTLLGHSSPFHTIYGHLSRVLAHIVILTGGEDHMPERFWLAFSKYPGLKTSEKELRSLDKRLLNWDCHLRGQPRGSGAGTFRNLPPLDIRDHEVLMAVVAAALVVDPAKRAPAKKILEIMHEGWGAVAEQGVLGLDRLGRMQNLESKMHDCNIFSINQRGSVSRLAPIYHTL